MEHIRKAKTAKGYRLAAILIAIICILNCKDKEIKPDQTETKIGGNPAQWPLTANGGILVDSVFSAALNGKFADVKIALEHGFNVDQPDPEGRTLLMLSAFNGHIDIVKMLLGKSARVDVQDTKDGSTALMFAASGPELEIVKLLVEAGAKVDLADANKHFTPLMWAAEEGHLKNVEYLLGKGANPTLKDIDGQTAETFATRFHHDEIVKMLKAASVKH